MKWRQIFSSKTGANNKIMTWLRIIRFRDTTESFCRTSHVRYIFNVFFKCFFVFSFPVGVCLLCGNKNKYSLGVYELFLLRGDECSRIKPAFCLVSCPGDRIRADSPPRLIYFTLNVYLSQELSCPSAPCGFKAETRRAGRFSSRDSNASRRRHRASPGGHDGWRRRRRGHVSQEAERRLTAG